MDVTNTKTISTAGRESYGINATSIGGGGGDGGMVVSGNIAGGKSTKTFTINVGGDGGTGGEGKAVGVINEGLVHTTGDQSIGIRAQSVGGGGGDAGLMANLGILCSQEQLVVCVVHREHRRKDWRAPAARAALLIDRESRWCRRHGWRRAD